MKKRVLIILTGITICALCFSGCGTQKTAKQTELREQGIAAMEAGDCQGAIVLFNEGLQLSMGTIGDMERDLCYYKAAAQFAAGMPGEAQTTCSALINYDEKSFEAYFLRGSILADQGEIVKACEDYDRACQLNPDYDLYIAIFDNLDAQGYRTQAAEYLNEALEIKDNSADGCYYRGVIHYKLLEYVDAKSELEEALNKGCSKANVYLAKIADDMGDSAGATELLARYANSPDVSSQVLGDLGDLEMAAGNYETALSYYRTGLELSEVTNWTQLKKGEIAALENLHLFSEAMLAAQAYVEACPEDETGARELIFLQTR